MPADAEVRDRAGAYIGELLVRTAGAPPRQPRRGLAQGSDETPVPAARRSGAGHLADGLARYGTLTSGPPTPAPPAPA
ncbi:hypothetical protein Shyhy01_00600 [Streptomyces hygroscopicus subsp. hygroscopicus]|uniref:hypothetical protein n=1 Tax=Streptomyces sp. KHY 26 TaxID=3097359 RepID=UPI0024A3CD24|nr:hypothetical protein [Streptomyces hygroscopicus]GLX47110.1 hypothetical protein Shyhy01_00600 [Streptomyces hygroscopicus subsp. hygroscopicus]